MGSSVSQRYEGKTGLWVYPVPFLILYVVLRIQPRIDTLACF